MKTILSNIKCTEKSSIYKLLHPWLQTGLLTSAGIKWQTRRKILTPTFHFNILKQFVDILIEESDCMIKTLKDVKGTVVKDLVPFMSEHTLNAICETAMGINLRDSITSQQYRDAVDKIIKIACYRCVRFWLHSEWLFKLLPIGRMQKKYLTIVHNFTDKSKTGFKERTHHL
ncbi:cytochrome P450 4C1-like [Pseudomyrmex gracilis]|uniref:cytochrome P450 4C1-like n=1 Tax=Pseudomyrmex gracilis TaxID=219809 RepID=UPI0009950618|nr:cytochrome P450 4C1-like [Pseudomyrmex gracilis]